MRATTAAAAAAAAALTTTSSSLSSSPSSGGNNSHTVTHPHMLERQRQYSTSAPHQQTSALVLGAELDESMCGKKGEEFKKYTGFIQK